jgi:hypothetical protein
MKKLALIAALTFASVSAHATTYVEGKNHVVIPHGCYSWSCVSVSLPGYFSHNVQPTQKARSRHANVGAAASTTSSTLVANTAQSAPAATPTPTAPVTNGSNVTVLPAPNATTQQ